MPITSKGVPLVIAPRHVKITPFATFPHPVTLALLSAPDVARFQNNDNLADVVPAVAVSIEPVTSVHPEGVSGSLLLTI